MPGHVRIVSLQPARPTRPSRAARCVTKGRASRNSLHSPSGTTTRSQAAAGQPTLVPSLVSEPGGPYQHGGGPTTPRSLQPASTTDEALKEKKHSPSPKSALRSASRLERPAGAAQKDTAASRTLRPARCRPCLTSEARAHLPRRQALLLPPGAPSTTGRLELPQKRPAPAQLRIQEAAPKEKCRN
ncbi:hypothetical protein NDU88_000794 [Pleurodeles waltl]|uniref:Uncharacterized protein n=1 Tax=Pleurodeles waltl TaxID=8319 RepID=A0AAV7TGU0_PLEWA|nr:hypothetical protein NDU88_000794 [Pleurodeles waltl]